MTMMLQTLAIINSMSMVDVSSKQNENLIEFRAGHYQLQPVITHCVT